MARDESAIKPVFNLQSYIKKTEQKEEEEELTDDEKKLAAGRNGAFWLTLKKHIENELQKIDLIAEAAIEDGAPIEQIGQNTIVITQVKGIVNRIFNTVEDSYEATRNTK